MKNRGREERLLAELQILMVASTEILNRLRASRGPYEVGAGTAQICVKSL